MTYIIFYLPSIMFEQIHGYDNVISSNSNNYRVALQLHKLRTNLNAIYGEIGRIPILLHKKLFFNAKYWSKLLTLDNESLLFGAYSMLKIDTDNGLSQKQS